ncbi:MAG: hypothetical protein IPH62_13845 [Ignavibacteriae bacterium]|nr:hypothetical protein [Ignavibacteriota bacterium]
MQNITEKDLFKYIFYPENLSKNIYDFISDNKPNFKNELEFLQNLYDEMQTQIPDSIVEKLNKRIASLNNFKSIILEKDKNEYRSGHDEYCLAAASESTEQLKCTTFRDKESNYLLKLFFGKTSNKLYIFAKDKIENKKVEITFLPSNSKFTFSTNELPFSFDENEIIDQIVLNFYN